MTTVAMTGHRPEKISDPTWVKDSITRALHALNATHLIQGMASGVDLWSAKCAYLAGIPYTCARPWAGHKARRDDERDYMYATVFAEQVVDVNPSETYPGAWVYQKRNEWMVDQADVVLAVWDGTTGGTFNAVKYARKQGKKIFLIDPLERSAGWLDE